jgi:hypothetical protein
VIRANQIIVRQISTKEAEPWILNRHYAKRMPSVSFAFGAFRESELVGIVTYGTPASAPLRSGVCGLEWKGRVLELNRLCCENEKNLASIIVSRSLGLLPTPRVVVSYADTAQQHIGYVYQAANLFTQDFQPNELTGKSKVRSICMERPSRMKAEGN